MLQSHSVLALSALLFSLTAVGCAASAEETGTGSEQALASERPSFKLYAEAGHTPDAACDLFTQLTFTTSEDYRTGRAELEDVVEGACKPGVDGTLRRYELTASEDDCGSHVFRGMAKVSGEVREITITDHRTRTCRDLVPAMIMVDERSVKTERLQSLFSFDG
jgi:hypothetical protein